MTEKQKLAIKKLELNKNTEIYVDYKRKEKKSGNRKRIKSC